MWVSPPRTKPLVAIADVDSPVMVVTTVAIKMIAMVSPVLQKHEKHLKLQANEQKSAVFNKIT